VKSGISANQLWTQVPVASRTVSLGAGAAGTIKSIQRGTCTLTSTETTNDATLSPAVVVASTELRVLGITYSVYSSGAAFLHCRGSLESTTVVRMTRGNAQNIGAASVVLGWEITEWY